MATLALVSPWLSHRSTLDNLMKLGSLTHNKNSISNNKKWVPSLLYLSRRGYNVVVASANTQVEKRGSTLAPIAPLLARREEREPKLVRERKETAEKRQPQAEKKQQQSLTSIKGGLGVGVGGGGGGGVPKYSKAARRFYNKTFRKPQRLSKVIAAAGVASRRSSEELIFQGVVSVNGTICKLPQTLVDPLKDSIYVKGSSLPRKLATKLYFVLNKPKGYICSSGSKEVKSALSLFDDYMKTWVKRNPGVVKPRLFTVGRLDVATSGLLLVTNDGEFAFKVSHPSSGLTKEYVATIEGKVTKKHLQSIADGTKVQGVHCVPYSVEMLEVEKGDSSPKQRLRIVVCEGRNREVRHLVENAGLEIIGLKRVRLGGYRMPRTLGLGKHKELTENEVKKILDTELQATV